MTRFLFLNLPFSLPVPQDEKNIVAVHCKAGKGRTGLMVCSLLLHLGVETDHESALRTYGMARTDDQKGVTIPSQRRYVGYYADFIKRQPQSGPYLPRVLLFKRIHFYSLDDDNKPFRPYIEVSCRYGTVGVNVSF